MMMKTHQLERLWLRYLPDIRGEVTRVGPKTPSDMDTATFIARHFATVGYYEAKGDGLDSLLRPLDILDDYQSSLIDLQLDEKFREAEGFDNALLLPSVAPKGTHEPLAPVERVPDFDDSRFQEMWGRYSHRFTLPVWVSPFDEEDKVKPFSMFWLLTGYIEGRSDAEIFAARVQRAVLLSLQDDEMAAFARRLEVVGVARDLLFKLMEARLTKPNKERNETIKEQSETAASE